jgi:hypothetical protein
MKIKKITEDEAFGISGTAVAWLEAGLGPYELEFGVSE